MRVTTCCRKTGLKPVLLLGTLHYPAVLLTALVAGAYTLIICALLVIDFTHRLAKVPDEQPQFMALKQQLVKHPDDQGLKQQLRALDLAMRRKYFRQQRFMEVGVLLLLMGISVTALAARGAAGLRRRIPHPRLPALDQDPDLSRVRLGPVAVALLVLAIATASWAAAVHCRSVLPDSQSANLSPSVRKPRTMARGAVKADKLEPARNEVR